MSFEFKNPQHQINFKCNLIGERCIGTTRGGQQCRRRTVKMLPTCYQHTKSMYGVEVRPSQIPNGGNGLFAVRFIPNQQTIVPYLGETLSNQQLINRYGNVLTAPYTINESHNHNVDSACKRGLGSYINDKRGFPQFHYNSRFVTDHQQPYGRRISIRATRDIQSGEEIFVKYYGQYWGNNNANQHSQFSTRRHKFRHL
jgi:SET domain-containing protein